MQFPRIFRRLALGAAGLLAFAAVAAFSAEIRVMTSGGFTAPYQELTPQFEKATGHKVITAYGASQGGAPDSIPSRLDRGEPVDIVILAAPALDGLIKQGKVAAGSRVDLVRSSIGMSVKSGAPKPDISTVEALKKTLIEAKSIAYSASASGTYLANELFPRLGIWDQIKGKSKRIESERVGTVVARGDAELGFQQVSELLPIAGIDFVGTLPEGAQQVTIFSAGLAAGAKEPEAARELIRYFVSPNASPVITKNGLEPIPAR
jgi:molybdate transport system substrate-binding protein